MELTEEQRERIRVNRERALEIRKRREEERIKVEELRGGKTGGSLGGGKGKREGVEEEEEDDIELEEFEKGASQFVTRTQAMKVYCLPDGTLSVCSYVEKSNPQQSTWSAMKLYYRSEIRRRGRERFGGLQGLIEERARREQKRFERDYKCAEDIFEKKSKR